jgi:hypothetical protein
MAGIETFLTTPEIQSPAILAMPVEATVRHDIAVLSIVQAEAIMPDWLALAAEAIEDNPFLAPGFLTAAVSHEAEPLSISLAAVWRESEGIRKLVGLFPLKPVRRELSLGWPVASRAALWRHPLQPIGTPLIAGDVTLASETIAAFLAWLAGRRPRLSSVDLQALPIDGIVSRLVMAEAERRSLTVHRTADAAHSHGFHLPSSQMPLEVADVQVLKDPRAVRAATETFLCLDAKSCKAQGRDAIINTPRDAAFLRGVTRSLAIEHRLVVALYDKGERSAAALFVEGREETYLWNFIGPAGADPTIEAALAAATGVVIGKPVVAATSRPVAGFWTLPLSTASLQIGLSASPAGIATRLRRRMVALGIV